MSAKKEKKPKSDKKNKSDSNTPKKVQIEVPDFISYKQINIGAESIDIVSVQDLLSERAKCKLLRDFDRADAIARSLQAMNVCLYA